VVESAQSLGLEAAGLAVFDQVDDTYELIHARGLPEEYVKETHSASGGIPGLVKGTGETVVLNDYKVHWKAFPILKRQGFKAMMGTPVWTQGRLAAALVAGTRKERRLVSEDVEAFELLATLAGRALENARQFEDEQRTVERLGELDRLKRDFLSNVSHELRTPLTAIEGMGLTLEQQWEHMDEDTRRELLGRLNANAKTLDRIISTLLDFSRLEAGRMEVALEPVRIREHLEAVTTRLHNLLADHPLAVNASRDIVVTADRLLLDRVIENLLSNAVKHTPGGTPITVAAHEVDDEVLIEVADQGPGIPEEDLQYLGDRFFRGGHPHTRQTRGTGLGLALVREVLRLHGSDLEVSSREGQGARFSFRLPRARLRAAEQADRTSA
jgi:signal transduction histidine kinase